MQLSSFMPSGGAVRIIIPSNKTSDPDRINLATGSNAVTRVIERASVWVFSFRDSGQSFDR
ncbi:hypothetical protein MKX08_008832 [Trichoderma sp. CBMAI-0020]|nr:hypothetical protein MKX08_008832 [Trichoderma sp. CBMAI-0020]